MLFVLLVVLIVCLLFTINCKTSSETETPGSNYVDPLAPLKTLTLTSTAFTHGGKIPAEYTCEKGNISPPLHWGNGPGGTRSFAVVFYDKSWAFVHMVLFNLHADLTGLPEDINGNLPAGAVFGRGSFGKGSAPVNGYLGPCPSPGDSNDYFFYVYALDTVLNLVDDTGRSELMDAMAGHILAWGELLGIYY